MTTAAEQGKMLELGKITQLDIDRWHYQIHIGYASSCECWYFGAPTLEAGGVVRCPACGGTEVLNHVTLRKLGKLRKLGPAANHQLPPKPLRVIRNRWFRRQRSDSQAETVAMHRLMRGRTYYDYF